LGFWGWFGGGTMVKWVGGGWGGFGVFLGVFFLGTPPGFFFFGVGLVWGLVGGCVLGVWGLGLGGRKEGVVLPLSLYYKSIDF